MRKNWETVVPQNTSKNEPQQVSSGTPECGTQQLAGNMENR